MKSSPYFDLGVLSLCGCLPCRLLERDILLDLVGQVDALFLALSFRPDLLVADLDVSQRDLPYRAAQKGKFSDLTDLPDFSEEGMSFPLLP